MIHNTALSLSSQTPKAAATTSGHEHENLDFCKGFSVPRGRLCELVRSASSPAARTAMAIDAVAELQQEGALVAWLQVEGGRFFPPDAAASGVDLDSLLVLHLPTEPTALARAAELLLRSGSFRLLILDTEGTQGSFPAHAMARLHALCRTHQSSVLFLREKDAHDSLGPLIATRLLSTRHNYAPLWQADERGFATQLLALRNKTSVDWQGSSYHSLPGLTFRDEAQNSTPSIQGIAPTLPRVQPPLHAKRPPTTHVQKPESLWKSTVATVRRPAPTPMPALKDSRRPQDLHHKSKRRPQDTHTLSLPFMETV